MKSILVVLLGMILCLSCKQKGAQPENSTNADTTAESFMPVSDFLKEDLRKVDSFAGGIVLKTIRDEKMDSVFISPDELKTRSNAFMP